MKYILLLLTLFVFIFNCLPQKFSKLDLLGGYGYYEGFNIGAEYFQDSNKKSIIIGLGYGQFNNLKQKYIAITTGYNLSILRNQKNCINNYKWWLSNKIVLWQLEDDYYLWKAFSIIPAVKRNFILCNKIRISMDLGPSINIVLCNKRKTYKEVGWPYHVMPNCRIMLIIL